MTKDEITQLEKGMTLVPIHSLTKQARDMIGKNLWDLSAPPSRPDEEEFNPAYGFTIFSTDHVNDDTLNYALSISEKIVKQTKNKFSYNGSTIDIVATAVYNYLDRGKVTFKPFPGFGDESTNDTLVMSKPTYEAHAVASYSVNIVNKILCRPRGGGIGKQKEKIENSDMSNLEKILAIAKLSDSSSTKEIATFEDLTPSQRVHRAYLAHVLFGADMLTPVKACIVASPDGAKTLTEVYANSDPKVNSRNIGIQIAMCELFDIPIFNITNIEDRKALEAFFDIKGE